MVAERFDGVSGTIWGIPEAFQESQERLSGFRGVP